MVQPSLFSHALFYGSENEAHVHNRMVPYKSIDLPWRLLMGDQGTRQKMAVVWQAIILYFSQVSMLEVYNEALLDLLCGDNGKRKLDIKMQSKRLLVQGLTEVEVKQESDITTVMEMGDSNRTTAATKMNSSR